MPTVAETVPGYEASAWFGMAVPAGTPRDVIEKLNRAVNDALADPGMQAKLAELGGTLIPGTPEDFGKLIADETDKWAKVVKATGATAEIRRVSGRLAAHSEVPSFAGRLKNLRGLIGVVTEASTVAGYCGQITRRTLSAVNSRSTDCGTTGRGSYTWTMKSGIAGGLFMRRSSIAFLMAAGLSLGFGAAASAADMALTGSAAGGCVLFDWTGWYGGVNAGYSWGR